MMSGKMMAMTIMTTMDMTLMMFVMKEHRCCLILLVVDYLSN